MDFYMKLPRNKREFVLFLLIVSVLSVNILAPLITCFEAGFTLHNWRMALRGMPFIWISVVALVLVTYRPAAWLTGRIVARGDSFGAHIVVNILCTVLLMSVFLTVIGAWVGNREISLCSLDLFFFRWPRNFAVSFAVEACIAQPVARLILLKLHQTLDAQTRNGVIPS